MVSLLENSTTGLRWAIEVSQEPVLAPIDSSYELRVTAAWALAGSARYDFAPWPQERQVLVSRCGRNSNRTLRNHFRFKSMWNPDPS